jgi:choline dehydrogenase-like flavoprotein
MQARYSDEFCDLDGRYYGFKIEQVPAHSALIGIGSAWRSGRQYKQQVARSAHNAFFIVITRDQGAGRVEVDRDGLPILHYSLAPQDGTKVMRGVREAFRLHAAAGASEIAGPHNQPEPFAAGGSADLESYVDGLDRLGLRSNAFMLFSAHQMGTCRMGGLRSRAVVDPHGQSWDVPGLFVADASTFPTPSGVNPMITAMALAHWVAQTVKAKLG